MAIPQKRRGKAYVSRNTTTHSAPPRPVVGIFYGLKIPVARLAGRCREYRHNSAHKRGDADPKKLVRKIHIAYIDW